MVTLLSVIFADRMAPPFLAEHPVMFVSLTVVAFLTVPAAKIAPPRPFSALSAWQSVNVQPVTVVMVLLLVQATAPPFAFELHSSNVESVIFV